MNKKQMNTIYLFVTDYCNLNCEFCAMRSNNKDIKKEKLSQLEVKEHVIDKIRKANPRKLIVSGGEPFVLEDILDILKELKENINTKIIVKAKIAGCADCTMVSSSSLYSQFLRMTGSKRTPSPYPRSKPIGIPIRDKKSICLRINLLICLPVIPIVFIIPNC